MLANSIWGRRPSTCARNVSTGSVPVTDPLINKMCPALHSSDLLCLVHFKLKKSDSEASEPENVGPRIAMVFVHCPFHKVSAMANALAACGLRMPAVGDSPTTKTRSLTVESGGWARK